MKKKIGIFIFIVICSTVMLSDWIERIYIGRLAGLPGRYNSYVGIQKEQKDSIDMLVLGDSESMTSISPMELWKSVGITSYICGLFGIRLPENFSQPLFAKTCTDFWKRWHITLGVWFKNYIFYPVSISKTARKWNKFTRKHFKGDFGKYVARMGIAAMALFPVWISNGLWHGPKWNYIFYGLYYFGLIFMGLVLEPVRDRILAVLHINPECMFYKAFHP